MSLYDDVSRAQMRSEYDPDDELIGECVACHRNITVGDDKAGGVKYLPHCDGWQCAPCSRGEYRCRSCNHAVAEPGYCGECLCEDDGDYY